MWAARLAAPGRLESCEAPDRTADDLTEGQVLVRVRAGGICGSDLPFFRGATSPDGSATAGGFGRPGFPMHEIAGDVLASRHPQHRAGDTVVGWASAFDGIAERAVTIGDGLAPYDGDLDPAIAVSIQPLACVLCAVDQLGDVADRSVAVIGQGPIGLLFSHVAKDHGARHVTGVDRVERTGLAKTFGVDDAWFGTSDRWASELTDERAEVVIEAVGHQTATLNHAIEGVAFGGRILYFGIPDELSYPMNMRSFLRKNLTLTSGVAVDRRRWLDAACQYLRTHPELRDSYVTDVVDARDATDAFERALLPKPEQVKIVLRMP